jgi:multiple sugar transport system substrate-binding protein
MEGSMRKMSWLGKGMTAGAAVLALGAASVAAQDGVTITVGGVSGAELQWLQESVVPAFEAQMAEAGTPVTVELIDAGNVSGEDQRQQYVLDLSVGEGPDVMTFDGFWLPEFVDAGLLQPLPELVGDEVLAWEGWEQIPESLQQILSYQGNLYGVPRGTDIRVIWFNTEIFEQAGLPADWQPTSWEELLDAARTIQANVEGVTPLQLNAGTAMGEASTLQGYLMALLGTGHHIYDFEQNAWIVRSQGILDTLELYQTIYLDEELGDERWQLVQNGRDLSFEAFANGQVGMLVEGDFFWRSVLIEGGSLPMENRNERVSFALMPAQQPGSGYNGQDFVTISGGTGFVINSNTEHPAEAWALLSFMFSREQLEALQQVQPRIRARLDVPVTGDEVMTALVEQGLPITTIRPQLPEYNQVSEQARLMTERVVSGEMTPQEAMDAYATAVTEIVGAENVIELPVGE